MRNVWLIADSLCIGFEFVRQHALNSSAESVSGIRSLLNSLTLVQSGQFLVYPVKEVSW